MYKAILFIAVILSAQAVFAQTGNTVRIIVQNKDTKENIAEATVSVKDTEISIATDAIGKAEVSNIPDGERIIEVFSPGFDSAELKLTFPLTDTSELTVFLELNNEVGEVTVTSTRTGREIDAEPSRVEAIDEEEIDEKISMRPANVSMVLH
ncbi:MAG: carboxypeptidase-like regulatory domain-containing protein, partial [Saprospiraceae bacterium]|nr:carboxypeptidase-like regulatory domain-containing protein [Pyrinomonadaceae bacterium]